MMNSNVNFSLDPYSPAEIAQKAEQGGVVKANLGFGSTLMLSILAGAFIGLGAMFSTVVATETKTGYGVTRLLVGLAFSLGLILVVVGGAELFTGNNLIVMAWAHRKVSSVALLRNWTIVYVGNFIGAVATVYGVYLSGIWTMNDHKVGAAALTIAAAKCNLTWIEAFMRGVFCNALVCLAVWLAFSARNTTDKIVAVIFPITAFVAAGLEHSIANMYFIPLGLLLRGHSKVVAALTNVPLDHLTLNAFVRANLVPVTLGNIVGGAVMVGLVYWFIYLRNVPTKSESGATM